MGRYVITIDGTGLHHNDNELADANRMAADFLSELLDVGHRIHAAEFQCIGRGYKPEPLHVDTPTIGLFERPEIVEDGILRYFEYSHLPDPLQRISVQVAVLAQAMHRWLPSGAEKAAGLRKLLEAKDCFVRATLGDGK